MTTNSIRRFFKISWLIMGIALAYHQLFLNEALPVSPFDLRSFSLENQVRRGGIYDRRGELLANTQLIGEKRILAGNSWLHTVGYHLMEVGESGLELRYSRELSGYDTAGKIARILAEIRGEEAIGANLMTTLDGHWQAAAVRALGWRKGTIVVLDPVHGDILAMVSRPCLDPNELYLGEQALHNKDAPLLNRATSGLYPPGSLFKIIVASAAYRYGMDMMEFQCEGSILVNGRRFHDAEKKAHGRIGLNKALCVSCNSYFIQLGRALGERRLRAEARRWGLCTTPSLPIPAQGGRFPERFSDDVEFAAFLIGQGKLLVTPLQIARAYGVVAAGGKLPPLRLVNAVDYPWCGGEQTISRPPAPRVISRDHALRLHHGLRGVVTQGTGWRSDLTEVIVAGKTGTAEMGGSTPSHAWFAAIGEYRNERRVVLVLVEQGGNGGRVAAPIAGDILKSAQRGEYW